MSKILKLFKFQLDNRFTIFKQKDLKTILTLLFKFIVIVTAITLALYLLLNKVFFILNIEINAQFLALVLLLTQGISFCFAMFNIISTLYLSKDNELLMVIPVTFNQLFVSKAMVMYVSDLIYSMYYMLPVFLTIGWLGGLSFSYFLIAFLILPILPILPIAIASIISIPIMFILKFFKNHLLLSIISILTIVAVVFVLYMILVSKISGAFNIMEKQIETSMLINKKVALIGRYVIIFYQLAQALLSLKLIYFPLLYLFLSIGLLALCFLLIKPFYYKIATFGLENTTVIKSKVKPFVKRKHLTELLLNEARTIFRSPGYIFQFFLFPLFMPLIVYAYDKLLISIAVNQAGQNMIFGSHVLILCIIALMGNTISSIAISKDGANFYIAKTTPVNLYTQVIAKLLFNFIVTISAILITTISTLLFTELNVGVILLSSLIVIVLTAGHICHSFDMDLRSPVLDWYDNSEISQIGKSTTKSIIYALVLSAIMCLIVTFLGFKGIFVALLVSIIYTLGRIHLLYVRTRHYYNIMEI